MRRAGPNPNERKSSKLQTPNYDESGLLQQEMSNPAFFQPMNEAPILTKRLSQRPQAFQGESQRNSFAQQPSSRPSFAAARQDAPRDLLPLQEMPGAPQLQGRSPRQMSPSRARKSRSPAPPVIVTPPESSDRKKDARKSRSAERKKTKSDRPSNSKDRKRDKHGRTSRVESGQPQEMLHPYMQEHIMAERAIRESLQVRSQQQQQEQSQLSSARRQAEQDPNGMHEYLQEHFLAMADREGHPFPVPPEGLDEEVARALMEAENRDHQQVREERQRRHREKKKNRKKGWFGRKSDAGRTGASPDTSSVESDGNSPPQSPRKRSTTPSGIGSRLVNAVLPRRAKKEHIKKDNPDAPRTINDPLLQQAMLESIKQMSMSNPPDPRPPQRTRSGPQVQSSQSDEPRSSRRRRQSHAEVKHELDQVQHDVDNFPTDQGDGLDLRQQPEPQPPASQGQRQRSFSQPDAINMVEQSPADKQSAVMDELKEIAKMFAADPNSGFDEQQFLREQQAALEALQRQQREEASRKPPPPPPQRSAPPPSTSESSLPPPPSEDGSLGSEHYPEVASKYVPPLNDGPANNQVGSPTAAAVASTPRAAEDQLDYCGHSYDGSRSTRPDEEDDFFDWGSVDSPPPIREAVTRDSFVSDITMPRAIGGDGEYYSESEEEEEDFYAENYDSDDYVDEDEWERLEKLLQKGGPEAERQWAEFLKRQGQQEVNDTPVDDLPEVKEQSRPYDGGYAPTQMDDSDGEREGSPLQAPRSPLPRAPQSPLPHSPRSPLAPSLSPQSPSMANIRTTFVCECCAERKSTSDHGHSCDNWETPHKVCSVCIRNYLETPDAKFRMVESANKQTMYQVKCFTALDGTSCNDCNSKISFQLTSIFPLADLETWLVRQRNRLHRIASKNANANH